MRWVGGMVGGAELIARPTRPAGGRRNRGTDLPVPLERWRRGRAARGPRGDKCGPYGHQLDSS
eukprot:7104547-Prymnesium_polylepis.1